MEKRVLLATLLSLAFLFIWQYLTYKPQQEKQSVSLVKQEEQKIQSKQEEVLYEPYVVETDKIKIVFNKYGAGIREVYIKEEGSSGYTLLCNGYNDSLYVSFGEKFNLKQLETEAKHDVIFFTKNETVTYSFVKDNPYVVKINVKLKQPKKINFVFQHYIHSDKFVQEPNIVHLCRTEQSNNKEMLFVERLNKIEIFKTTDLRWVAVGDKYYIFGIIFPTGLPFDIKIDKKDKNTKYVSFTNSIETAEINYDLLIAPKKISLLTSFGQKFIHTVQWGTFAPLSKLFYNILTFFYKMFGNYGIAIICLTLITQVFTLPLTLNSIKATIKMKKLQPQIQLLQKVYKDDPKRLNMEIMNLYKEKKVNPFGGCLPLLLQIPIFWALFTMLRNTYDLRGAKFMLWIKDLSSPDRLVIPGTNFGIPVLVLLMGATMLVQQLLSGAFKDPQQKTFAIMMPVIFTVLFINFPSGLVLYWFVNNLLSIIIQSIVSKNVEV